MKKRILYLILSVGIAAGIMTGFADAPEELSNEYVTVKNYKGIEIEKVVIEDADDEDVDKVIEFTLGRYIDENELPEDTELTDEIVQDGFSETAKTVEEYRAELKEKIQKTKENSAKDEELTRVWEKMMDNSTVKEYPEDRLKAIKQDLVELYESYAAQAEVEYEEYMEACDLDDSDLDEAAEASLKQELVAEVIGDEFNLHPTEEEFAQAEEEYMKTYKFATKELLYVAVTEEQMRGMVLQDRVKEWLHEQCTYVEETEE